MRSSFLTLCLALLFIFSVAPGALADQINIGGENDPYMVDEDFFDSLSNYPSYYAPGSTASTDSVHVSSVDPGGFPTICTYVEVLDSLGEPVGGLNSDSFCVYQDTTQISSFTVTELQADSCITSTCLVIDVSGSMGSQGKLTAAKAAANAFIDQMDPFDRVAIVTFSNCYNLVQAFTSNQTLLHSKINSLSSGGWTAALDGIWAGVDLTTTELGSKAVIALSDGMENWSQYCGGSGTPDGLNDPQGFTDDSTMIVNLALGAGIPIYTISLGSSFDPHYLIGVAAGSGGSYYHAPTGNDIDSIYVEIKERLCTRYYICYESPDTIQNGEWHDVTICLKDSLGNCEPCGTGTYQETAPPVITRTPATINLESICQPRDTDVEICAWVTDMDTPSESLDVKLFYRNSDQGSYTEVVMTRTDSLFCYTVPGSILTCDTDSLFYYIWASDHKTTVSSPSGAPPAHHGVGICPNELPQITCPPDLTVSCDASTDPANTGTATATDPDGPTPTVSYTDSETAGACPQEKTISRRWKAIDSCGDSAVCIQTITVDDSTDPVITCPADVIIECGASTDADSTGWATASDDCDASVDISYSDAQVGNVITRTWTATDDCGNSSQCDQTITIDDTTPPTVTCPADVSVQCTADVPPVDVGSVTAVDDCDPSPVVTHLGDVTDGNSCPEIITRSYAATDANGNADTCTQTITIDDTNDPVITCPADVTIDCAASTDPASTGSATATDNCDNDVTVTYSDSEVGGACPQEKTITRTWTATDNCGNTAQCVQTITVEDNIDPVITCPADLTVDCTASTDPASTGSATATDNCDNDVAITYSDSEVGGACPQEKTITRTWTATDDCGNTAQCAQTITVEDNIDPVITCPADTTIDCAASTDPANTGSATATDNCDNDVAITYSDSEVGGACPQEKTITRTWTATDDCGNTAQCAQTITVEDNIDPVITCPADITIDCAASTDPANTGSATATDNCDNDVTITYSDTPNGGGITRTWTATDDCGNSDQCVQTITIEDNTPPTVTCPADISVQCAADVPAVDVGSVTAVDDCDPSPVVTHLGDVTDGNSCPEIITRRYVATDISGNADTCTQTITIDDTIDPVITCPADLTVDCTASTDPASTGSATATDNCDNDVAITYSDSEVGGACPQEKTITRTWTATDDCGNTAQCVQTIQVTDDIAPTITCPVDVAVDCLGSTDPDSTGWPTGTDNCDASLDFTYTDAQVGDVITRTWTATDDCGNTHQCVQTITIEDTTPPTLECPSAIAVQCPADVPAPDPGLVTVSDDCDPDPVVVHIGDATDGNTCPETITRTYRATDASSNYDECTQIITIDDTIDPVITCPAPATVECGGSIHPDFTGYATATDNCDPDVTITYADVKANEITTRTWTATDDCGNTAQCEQIITIQDTEPPSITCPTAVSVQCPADVPDADTSLVTASDGCDDNPVVTHVSDVSDGNTCPEVITRTYRATDASGNFAECTQTITIDDTIDPEITCPADANVTCGGSTHPDNTGYATATDNCDADVEVTYSDSQNGDVITRTWTATDDCGNTDECVQTITTSGGNPPTAECPGNQTMTLCDLSEICIDGFGCTDPDNDLVSSTVNGEDLTGSEHCFTPVEGENTLTLICTDACDLADTCQTVITVILNQAPTCSAPNDTSLFLCERDELCLTGFECNDPDGNLESTVVNGEPITNGQYCFTPVAGLNTVALICTDSCGAADTCEMTVTLTVNAPPVADAGADQTYEPWQAGQQICWNAGCSDPDDNLQSCDLVSGPGNYDGSQICFTPTQSGTYEFVLCATDDCDVTVCDTVQIEVVLNNPPEITVDAGGSTYFCGVDGAHIVCVPFSVSDPEDNLDFVDVTGPMPVTVNFDYFSGTGSFCFDPPGISDVYTFDIYAEDIYGAYDEASHQHTINVDTLCDTTVCMIVKVEKTHNSLQGHYEYVSITIEESIFEMGGFDFLIYYDASALHPAEATPGQLLEDCGWEYFTYRFGAQSNCDGSCPSGLLRIVAIADVNNGPWHPSCYGPPDFDPYELAQIKFLVTNDRSYDCMYVPIGFFWLDCGDNAVSNVGGDTLYIDARIYAFEGNRLWDEWDDDLYPEANRIDGLGAPDYCLEGDKTAPRRCIEFWEGGIDIICKDSIDARGDINMNGIANEIADAVLFTNYFLHGIPVLDIAPEGQIAASDVNNDGITLSVGDLVYLIRIITGDALPYAKLAPFAQDVEISFDGSQVSANSGSDIGAMFMTFRVNSDYTLTNLTDMSVVDYLEGNELRVLVYDISTESIPAGHSDLVRVSGDAELLSAEVADYHGNMMTTSFAKTSLPDRISLGQNYPNPFNPQTVIEFTLPRTATVTLEVFNISGQRVATVLDGSVPAGYHRITFDGTDEFGNQLASGVYLYRLTTDGFSETRKMMLVK